MSIPSNTSSWTVLIVDDEPDNLEVPKKILSFHGAQVHTAKNGLEGLELLTQITPTFVLLDLSMPKMDGWKMLESMRASPQMATIPVIALTAHAMEGDKVRALAAGFDGYITKPFWLKTFWTEINRCLQEFKKVTPAPSPLSKKETRWIPASGQS